MRPGENIVLVLAASSHRQAALDAAAFLIDWLKTKAPFWKREDFADGGGAWVDARETDEAAASRWG
jgi:molybdopterin synthase catalytic subunit